LLPLSEILKRGAGGELPLQSQRSALVVPAAWLGCTLKEGLLAEPVWWVAGGVLMTDLTFLLDHFERATRALSGDLRRIGKRRALLLQAAGSRPDLAAKSGHGD